MVHCGYEPTAVDHTFSSFGGMWGTVKAMLFNRYANPAAQQRLDEEKGKPHGPMAHLVNLGLADDVASRRTKPQSMFPVTAKPSAPPDRLDTSMRRRLVMNLHARLLCIRTSRLVHPDNAPWEAITR
jgi:hypothetical protein